MAKKLKMFRLLLLFCFAVSLIFFQACTTTSLDSPLTESNKNSSINQKGLKPGKFIKQWLVLGPVPVFEGAPDDGDVETQKAAFKKDQIPLYEFKEIKAGKTVSIGNREYTWELFTSKEDIIDLDKKYNNADFAISYLCADIEMNKSKKMLFSVGSDDSVKIWLNGEPVHEKWASRGITVDSNTVSMSFKKGANRLVVKVQDVNSAWAFSCRPFSAKQLADRLINTAGLGILDDIKMLLEHGADVNAKNEKGYTPLHSAKMQGRKDAVKLLTDNGADKNIAMPAKEKLVDMLFEKKTKGKTPGAAVLISRDGKVLYKKGFGYADIGHMVPVTPKTKFRIGSISKQFTAAGILKLMEDGKLALTDTLSKFLPDFPRGDEVTIYHLLTHTSGIHSYTNMPDFMDTVTVGIKPEDLIKKIAKEDFDFNPGEKWLYNNSGYFILGYLIKKISGKTYEEYLKQNIFDPLDMTDTGVHTANAILDHEAQGYSYVNGSFQKAVNWDMSRGGGAGALYSTVEDLFKWNEAVFNGKVLEPEILDAAFTPAKLKDGSKADANGAGYGFGWGISTFRGLNSIGHSGGLNGFVTNLTRITNENLNVTVLTNCTPVKDINPAQAVRDIMEIYLWEGLEAQPSYVIDKTVGPELYADYAGNYTLPGVGILNVINEDGKLFTQLANQPRVEIFPSSKYEFFIKVVDAQVSFVPDKDGKIDHIVLHQNGANIKSMSKKAMESRKEIELSPDELEAYTGVYKLASNFAITVTVEKGILTVQATGQSKIPFYPESKTKFFCKLVDAQISFIMGEDGRADILILHQGGFDRKSKSREALTPPKKEITLSSELLESYAGIYNLNPDVTLTVTVEGNLLQVRLAGQNKIPFYAESETKFFSKLVDAQISFVSDKDGRIDHLILHQGNSNQKADRYKELTK